MPCVACGAAPQKSTSQRLCACSPAHLRSNVARSRGTPLRWARMSKNGGSVFGKMISAAHAVGVHLPRAARRCPS